MPRNLKSALLTICQKRIEDKITVLNKNLNSIIDSRNNETKSSAGDKYETSRSLMQMEEERLKNQLSLALLMKTELSQIKNSVVTTKVDIGSIVITDKAQYFISVGLGKIVYEDETFYCISKQSPIGKKLLNRIVGDSITFNGNSFQILKLQ